jgi:hypothetical protein
MINGIEPDEVINGLMIFRNAARPPTEDVLSFCENGYTQCLERDYIWIDDEWAVNRSMHRFSRESIAHQSVHLVGIDDPSTAPEFILDYFAHLDDVTYRGLIRYIEEYPSLLGNVWWRTKGHAIYYKPGSWMGLHNDNDANYHPRHEPDHQLALRHVVGVLIFLTDTSISNPATNQCVGGLIDFPYIGHTHTPMAGDMLIFPSNYYGSHEVKIIEDGRRISYISYFGHGSRDDERGIRVTEKSEGYTASQTWEYSIVDDYASHINSKYVHPHQQGTKARKLSLMRTTRPSDKTVSEIKGRKFKTGFDRDEI